MFIKLLRGVSELKLRLSPHEYFVLKGKGPERPFTGEYWWVKDVGEYHCRMCDNKLFPSHYKFFPTTGHCAFFESYKDATVQANGEVVCSGCQSHLGTVSDDGPAPTYKHLCVKSAALLFKPMPFFTVPPKRKELRRLRKKAEKKKLKEKKEE